MLVATSPPDVPSEPVQFGEWEGTRYRLTGGPDWMVADDEHVYLRRDSGQIDVIQPSTGAIIRSVQIQSPLCQGIGVGGGRVWTCVNSDVISFDPVTGEVGDPIGIVKAHEQGHLPVAFGRLWVLIGDGSVLAAIDPASGEIAEEIELGARCTTDVGVDGTSVWVACKVDDTVLRVDPATSTVEDRVDVTEPNSLAFTDGAVWVGASGAVVRVDAATAEIIATIDGGTGRFGGIGASDEGAVWVRRAGAPLTRIDPATNEVTDALELDVPSGGDVLVAHGAVWSTAFDDATLFRIDLASGS